MELNNLEQLIRSIYSDITEEELVDIENSLDNETYMDIMDSLEINDLSTAKALVDPYIKQVMEMVKKEITESQKIDMKIAKLTNQLSKLGQKINLNESKESVIFNDQESDVYDVLVRSQLVRESLENEKDYSKNPKFQIAYILEKVCELTIKKKDIKLNEFKIDLPQGKISQLVLENVEIEKAEIILASKNISNEIQKSVEKLAKIQVDELMSIVERIGEEYGRNTAVEFEESMGMIFDEVLNCLKTAKSDIDDHIASKLQGQSISNDMESFSNNEIESDDVDQSQEMNDQDDIVPDTLDSQEGPEDEPLGRARKS